VLGGHAAEAGGNIVRGPELEGQSSLGVGVGDARAVVPEDSGGIAVTSTSTGKVAEGVSWLELASAGRARSKGDVGGVEPDMYGHVGVAGAVDAALAI
jgi:hypothetical protein